MRVAAVWFPDWPIQAAGGQGPMVIARNHAVAVCDRKARRAGVRRGCACVRPKRCAPRPQWWRPIRTGMARRLRRLQPA